MKIVILDLNNLIFRAYHGIRQPLKTPDGTPSNAIYGVFNMIHRIVSEFSPDIIVAALDSRSSIRKQEYSEYKNNRSSMPDPLKQQIPLIREMLVGMGVNLMHQEGLEADDLINSIVKAYQDDTIIIASSDKDLMQLVNDKVLVYDSMKNVVYDESKVKEKFGIDPKQILDYLALLGDSSDNIPGVEGIGEKKAISLIKEFESIENLYGNLEKVTEKVREKLIAGKDSAFLSRKLAELRVASTEIPVDAKMNKEVLLELFQKWNMKSAIEKIKNM